MKQMQSLLSMDANVNINTTTQINEGVNLGSLSE